VTSSVGTALQTHYGRKDRRDGKMKKKKKSAAAEDL
jgi:hypothetical protein